MTDPVFRLAWNEWDDPRAVARELGRGADPNLFSPSNDSVLERMVSAGSAETMAMVLPLVNDVDAIGRGALDEGRTALWTAVFQGRTDMARLLVAAGADPYLDMMSGWSPARLALAGPTPALFGPAPAGASLTGDEQAVVNRAQTVISVAGQWSPGEFWSIAVAASVTGHEALDRLGGILVDGPRSWGAEEFRDLAVESMGEECPLTVRDIAGGCLLFAPLGFEASTPWSWGGTFILAVGRSPTTRPKALC